VTRDAKRLDSASGIAQAFWAADLLQGRLDLGSSGSLPA
jgi:hypothetical protein